MQTTPKNALPEDEFLSDFLGAMALDFALRKGFIDQLAGGKPLPDTKSAVILQTLLQAAGVMEGAGLTSAFATVLTNRRDILEAKLQFLRLASKDVVNHFDDLLLDLPAFMGQSATFALFSYDQAMSEDTAAIAATRPWVEYVTALSRAEAPVLAPHLPLTGAKRLLEVGGNTGVMSAAALDLHPDLTALILDLPAVCAIGADMALHPRLRFAPGDARKEGWPDVDGQMPDAILFKSVLHDWPKDHAMAMLDRATAHLAPGGRLIVCERGPFEGAAMPFSMTANLVFAPFYRAPDAYRAAFADRGLTDVRQVDVLLDMPFHIVSGVKP